MPPANPAQRGFHPVCQEFLVCQESPVYQGFLAFPAYLESG